MDSAESWKDAPGYEGFYEVSDLGRVRSLVGWRSGPGRPYVLTPRRTTRGYFTVALCRDGVRKQFSIHSLVLTAFVGPRPEGMECFHWDDDHANNALSNLKWSTHAENCAHKTVTGHIARPRGEKNGRSKMTDAQAEEFRMLRSQGWTQRLLAERFGIGQTQASRICRGESRAVAQGAQ